MKDKPHTIDMSLNKTQQVLYQKEFKRADKVYKENSRNR